MGVAYFLPPLRVPFKFKPRRPRRWIKFLRRWTPKIGLIRRPHPVNWAPRVALLGGSYTWGWQNFGKGVQAGLTPELKNATPEWRLAQTGPVRSRRIHRRTRRARRLARRRRYQRRRRAKNLHPRRRTRPKGLPLRPSRRTRGRPRVRRLRFRPLKGVSSGLSGGVAFPRGRPQVGGWAPLGYRTHWKFWQGSRRHHYWQVRSRRYPVGRVAPTWGFYRRRRRTLTRWRRRRWGGWPTYRLDFQADYLRGLTRLVGSRVGGRPCLVPGGWTPPMVGSDNRRATRLTSSTWKTHVLQPPPSQTGLGQVVFLPERPTYLTRWNLSSWRRRVFRRRSSKVKLRFGVQPLTKISEKNPNVLDKFVQTRFFYFGGGGRRSYESRTRRAEQLLERRHFRGQIRRKLPLSRLVNLWIPARGVRLLRRILRIRKKIRFERRRGINSRRRRNRRRRRIWYPNPLWRFLKRFHRSRLLWKRPRRVGLYHARTKVGFHRATTFLRSRRRWARRFLKGFRWVGP